MRFGFGTEFSMPMYSLPRARAMRMKTTL